MHLFLIWTGYFWPMCRRATSDQCCMHVYLSNYHITWFCHSVYLCIWMMYCSYLCVLNVSIRHMCRCSRFELPISDRNRHVPDRYVPLPIFCNIVLVLPSAFPVPGKKIQEQEQLQGFSDLFILKNCRARGIERVVRALSTTHRNNLLGSGLGRSLWVWASVYGLIATSPPVG